MAQEEPDLRQYLIAKTYSEIKHLRRIREIAEALGDGKVRFVEIDTSRICSVPIESQNGRYIRNEFCYSLNITIVNKDFMSINDSRSNVTQGVTYDQQA